MKRFVIIFLILPCLGFSQLSTSFIQNNVSCFGAQDGGVNVSITGGTLPYTFLWSNGATTEDLNGLGPGNYTLTVHDAGVLPDPMPWTYNLTGINHTLLFYDNILVNGQPIQSGDFLGVFFFNPATQAHQCGGYVMYEGMMNSLAAWGDENLTPTKEGFAPGEAFVWKLWRAANGQVIDLTATYDNSGFFPDAGTYVMNGMSAAESLTGSATIFPLQLQLSAILNLSISEPQPLVLSYTNTPILCQGDFSNLSLSATGGTSPYFGTGSFSLPAGNHFLTVSDVNACTQNLNAIIDSPQALTLSYQESNHTVSLSATGGTPPYTFLWSNGSTTQSQLLDPGPYVVSVSDTHACQTVINVLVPYPIQSIALPSGWSYFSTYLIPVNSNIASVLLPVIPQMVLAENSTGEVFWPAFGINSIGNLQIGSGYKIKMNSSQTLSISGTPLQATQTSFLLPSGWSIMGYLHQNPALIANMLSPITPKLVLAKNSVGQIYWPANNLNPINTMYPGQGYFIKLIDTAQFTYPPLLPVLSTTAVSGITTNSAQSGGNIIFAGGGDVTSRGVCWNTTGNPTLADNFTSDGSGPGVFSSILQGLSQGTTYFLRAYSTNIHGTSYGNEISFNTISWNCGTSTLSDYNGNTYNTVQIGSQCWMKENLKATHYSDGTVIPLVLSNSEWSSLSFSAPAYCNYENSISTATTYGRLYTWAAATKGNSSSTNPSGVQGICPIGWHLPSDSEWKQLELFLGMSQSAVDGTAWRGTNQGGMLKSTSYWSSPNTGATNSVGFNALPGGNHAYNGPFTNLGLFGYWWTASEQNDLAVSRILGHNIAQIGRNFNYKNYGFSVRCVKDN